ncbi:MAG: hypothetical protein MI802_13095 [Desulfobacterales bacterium]|nr:hypothetical protein [Desulfobacterales bacterium]
MINSISNASRSLSVTFTLAALAAILLLGAAPASAVDFASITVYNCSNSDDGVDVFSYNLNDDDKSFSYDSASVGKGSNRTFYCEGSEGCHLQYASLFGDDVWEEAGNGEKRYVLSKASGFLGFVATIYVGSSTAVCSK